MTKCKCALKVCCASTHVKVGTCMCECVTVKPRLFFAHLPAFSFGLVPCEIFSAWDILRLLLDDFYNPPSLLQILARTFSEVCANFTSRTRTFKNRRKKRGSLASKREKRRKKHLFRIRLAKNAKQINMGE